MKKRIDTATSRENKMEELRGQMPATECAARLGIHFSTWYRWERGDTFPTPPYLMRIEDFFSHIHGRTISYREIWTNLVPDLEGL